jgi:hypothetical protein
MRKPLVWVLAAWLWAAGQLAAQAPPAAQSGPASSYKPGEGGVLKSEDRTTGYDKAPANLPSDAATTQALAMPENAPTYRIWARTEYLVWWVKDSPLPVPLVTTGDPRVGFDPNLVNTVNTAGAIGQPGTTVLLGNGGVHFPAFSGLRVAAGAWIDPEQKVGIEGSGFLLQRRTSTFSAASDQAGNPPLYFPIFSVFAGAERAVPIADPLRSFSGDVEVTSNLQLWGAESNALYTFLRRPGLEITLLAGFRYADLRESLHNHNTTTDLLFNNVTVLNDDFATSNQFYGGQIGSRLALQLERFSLDVTGKVAVGATHQVIDIEGDITQVGPNPLVPPGLGTSPGGLFAQPSNIGRRTTDQFTVPFTVLPSVEVKLAYALTRRIRIFAGYDLMYWNGVVRPGSQVNRNVNLTQNAVLDPNGAGALVGAAQPTPLFVRSDFWAQGVTFGLEFRY